MSASQKTSKLRGTAPAGSDPVPLAAGDPTTVPPAGGTAPAAAAAAAAEVKVSNTQLIRPALQNLINAMNRPIESAEESVEVSIDDVLSLLPGATPTTPKDDLIRIFKDQKNLIHFAGTVIAYDSVRAAVERNGKMHVRTEDGERVLAI